MVVPQSVSFRPCWKCISGGKLVSLFSSPMYQQRDNYEFLTQGPVHRVILTMAVPTIISMLVMSLYNVVDTFFVGQLDTQSTAAVGVVFSLVFFIQAFSFFFGNGSGNYISRELGARRRRNAEQMVSTAFFYALALGLLVMILGELALRPLSLLLGSTPTILPYTMRYMRIVLLGAPLMTTSLCLNNQMRFQGNARYAMMGIIVGALLNVLLDPLLIFVFQMGVEGAAWATVIGQAVSLVILLRLSYNGKNIPVHWRNFSSEGRFVREIIAGGTPSLSRQGLGCVASIMLNVAAGAYGDAAIAGMSIVNRITMFIMSIVVGLGQGFQPFCGFCYGAGLYRRLYEGFWFCVRVGTLFLLTVGVLFFVFAHTAVSVFRDDADVIAVGVVALRWQLVTYPLSAFIMTGNMMMQTIRKPWRANILAAARRGLFFIPLILILPYFFGLLGVEACQSVSDIFSFLLSVPIVWSGFRDMRKQEKEETAPLPSEE